MYEQSFVRGWGLNGTRVVRLQILLGGQAVAQKGFSMHTGETLITTKPGVLISGENRQFRVVDYKGNVEWYFCSNHAIKQICRDGVDGKETFIPPGSYLVEKLSDSWY